MRIIYNDALKQTRLKENIMYPIKVKEDRDNVIEYLDYTKEEINNILEMIKNPQLAILHIRDTFLGSIAKYIIKHPDEPIEIDEESFKRFK